MFSWSSFSAAAPTVAAVFERRHRAAGNLCMLGTTRRDGSARISPMEPVLFEDMIVLAGMPGTRKFADLTADPRFCLHTATADPTVADGDAKLFGSAVNLTDVAVHARFADDLLARTGFDVRGEIWDVFYVVESIRSASSLAVVGDHLEITVWTPQTGERVIHKT